MENTINTVNKRYDWLDAVKALAMLLVIFGHLGLSTVPVYQAYASYIKLPLFFAASGFVFNLNKLEKPALFLKERVVRILLPYFYLCILICLFNLFSKQKAFSEWAHESFYSVLTGSIYMWFLPVLFLGNLLFLVVFGIWKERNIPILVFAGISLLLGYILLPDKHILFCANEVFVAFPFMVFGYYFKQALSCARQKTLKAVALVCALIYLIIPALSVRLFGSISYINMFENHYPHFFLDMLISFCGVFAVFVFIQCFRIPKPVVWFGRNTMFYYAFHIPMFTLLWSFTQRITALSGILCGNGTHALVMIRCLITIADVVVLAPLCLLTNRYFPFLVGEKSRKNRFLPAADVADHE